MSRLVSRSRSLRRRVAIAGALLATSVGGLGVLPMAAHAAGSTLITGTAISGNARWTGAHVGVYAWTGGRWVWQGYVTTTNGAGNYSFYEPSGYDYYVAAGAQYPCSYSGGENLFGSSAWFLANGGKVNAQVNQNAITYYGSGCPS